MDGPTQALPTQAVDDGGTTEPVKKQDRVWGRLISLNTEYPNIDLTTHEVVIGREKNLCTVKVASQFVSKQHCKIVKADGDVSGGIVFLYDMSSNGTYVNGEKIGAGNKKLLQASNEIALVQGKKAGQSKVAYVYQYCGDAAAKKQEDDGGPEKHYIIVRELGKGAFASVKLALHKETEERWAIKCIDKKKFMMNSASRKNNALMEEVNILMKVSHPNIIGIKEVFDTEKCLYIVLELVTGGDLFERIVAEGHFTEDKAREIFRQLIDAIHYLHAQKIAHRDLKPENILLKSKENDVVKISDFGLSRIIGEGSFAKTMCGTPQYLAPEILTEAKLEGYGLDCDMWSLGVILYVMLSGTQPFDEERGEPVFEQIKGAKYSFTDDIWSTISAEAKDLIRKLLVVEPCRRYKAQDVIDHPWMQGTRLAPKSTPDQVEDAKLMQQIEAIAKKKKRQEELSRSKEEEEKRANTTTKRKGAEVEPEPLSAPSILNTEPKKAKHSAEHILDLERTSSEENHAPSFATPPSPSTARAPNASGAPPPAVPANVINSSTTSASTASTSSLDDRPMCKYGASCYRKNPQHLKEFRHPPK